MILAEGTRPVLVGIVTGLAGAWFATRLVSSMLYQVAPRDPMTFLALPLLFLVIRFAASWVPARRATAVSPSRALREDQ